MKQTKYDIFISYSRKDAPLVDSIVAHLEKSGFSIWLDRDGVESGDAFKRVIVKAIEDSQCVLFFSSVHSNISEWTAKEIGIAVDEKKYIIPIRIDNSKYNSEIKFDLINLDYIDLTDSAFRSEMLTKLIKTLSIKCGKSIEPNNVDAKISHVRQHIFSKTYWRPFIKDFPKRGNVVNFVLITLQVLGVLYSIMGACDILWSFSLPHSPSSSFFDIYGKGVIPGVLISIFALISNAMILKWNKNGIDLLFISFFIITIPTIWGEFEIFIYFSVFSLLGILTYLGLLFIPHKGISLWRQCKAKIQSLRYIAIGAISMWIILLTLFPLLMSKSAGFLQTSYTNGIYAIDARCNGDAFYVRRLANRLAYENPNSLGSDDEKTKYRVYFKKQNAEAWYKKAISISENDYDVFKGWEIIECYVDYIYFLANIHDRNKALVYLKIAVDRFGISEIEKEIQEKSYEYDRTPIRPTVLSFLSEIAE